jgi:hypothetical protein
MATHVFPPNINSSEQQVGQQNKGTRRLMKACVEELATKMNACQSWQA